MTTVAHPASRVPTVEIAAVSRPGRAPLAPGQRRAWFLQTRDLADASLNVAVSYRLTGALDVRRLRAAVAAVAERHRILCATYGLGGDGEPYQVVDAAVLPSWTEHDLSELSARSRDRRVAVLLRRAVGAPFDLTGEAPLRVTLIRTGAAEFVLSLVAHTIAWDEESASIFATALSAAYLDADGSDSPVTDVPVANRISDAVGAPDERPVRDDSPTVGDGFGVPRAEALGSAEQALDYWRRTLDVLPDALELPGRPQFAQTEAGRGRRAGAALPAELLATVGEFAAEHGVSTFAVFFAAWQAAVSRYTGATEFLVAAPVTTRAADTEELIGYYGNTVLLRGSCSAAETFAELVAASEVTCAGARAHGGVGIDDVVRAVNPSRTGGRDGLEVITQLGFAVRAEPAPLRLAGVTATRLDDEAGRARLPLRLSVVVGADSARLDAEYTTDRLEPALVDRLLRHYRHLLTRATAAPDTCLGDLELFDADEREHLLALSRGELVATPPTTLVRLFEDQVRARPDALALLAPGREHAADLALTYRDLDLRANRLAHWLIGQGIGTEDIVGLRSSTSVEFIVAVLAVLKAGGAYLPIDPAYPDERIAFLDADAGARLMLGPVELAAAEETALHLPEHPPTDAERRRPLRPGNLAYLVYTSGSTGQPKGVPVPHAAIAEHLIGFCAQWDLTAEDRVLQSSSVSFDASLLDIFVTLTVGACLVVPKPDAFRDIAHIAELISRCAITVLHMVPSTLSTFLLLPEVSEWGALRHVPVGGEALTGEVADRFAGVFDAELRNHYGPTEAVVCATHMPVVGPQGPGTVPIGIPNRNVYAYVLDERLGLVPDGVVGEIYLGGAQLARGYHDRPTLTAQRFVADPFLPGSRLYRTGDLARRNDSGALEFVGRADEQVKVRGFRIEPAEVRAALAGHPEVGQCAVVASADPALGTVLAAYVVPAAGTSPDLTALRAHVAATLPDYMVPAEFVLLDALPLTEHGKLDRRALPAALRAGSGAHRAPATETEIRLAALFAQLFGRTEIGAQDSFFELGGHSLLAAGLVARIRAEFGVDIDVRVPFDTPTVAGLAALIESRPPARIPLPPLRRQADAGPAPLTRAQRASWDRYRSRKLAGTTTADPVAADSTTDAQGAGNVSLAVRLDGRLDVDALRHALVEAVGRHDILRTVFTEVDGVPVASRSAEPIAITVLPTSGAPALATARTAAVRQSFDPCVAPPLDIRILVADKKSHVVVLTAHELIADHRSLRILLAETAIAYRARVADAEPHWPAVEFDFADVARWEDEAADALAAQRDYWRAALAGAPVAFGPAPDLPIAAPSAARRAGVSGHSARFPVPAQLRQRLRALAESAGASEFMLYQAAVLTLLHKLGAGTDLVLGAAVGGRGEAMAAGVVGPLTGVVALRTDLRGNPSLRTVLDRARATALAGYGHQDVARDAVDGSESYATILHFSDQDRLVAPHFGAGLTATVLPPEFDGALRDIGFGFTADHEGGFAATVTLNAERYHRDTAHLFARRMLRVLGAFADTPDLALADLDVMPAEERRRVLGEWSCGVEVSEIPDLADLLDRALTYPSVRPALRCGTETLDFGTVCARLAAARVQHTTIDGPLAARDRQDSTDDTIPATAQRGGPLDTLLTTLERLVAADTTGTLLEFPGTPSFRPAALAAAVADRRGVAASRDTARPDPARSTAQCRVIGVEAGPVGLLVEALAGLADGALVELAPEGVAAVVSERATHVVATATALPADATEAGTRRWDVLGDKGLRVAAPQGMLGMVGYAVSGYAGTVARGPLDGSGRVRPVPGARVVVLDESGAPVPPGVTGQVWIGGVAQAGPDGGELLPTGDRAHWTTDGWLKFA